MAHTFEGPLLRFWHPQEYHDKCEGCSREVSIRVARVEGRDDYSIGDTYHS